MALKSTEVFGISTKVLEHSYIDRGELDSHIRKLLERDTHIALRGESKCGKSWLRQKNIPDAIVVQCRLNKSVRDIFIEALSQLGLSVVQETTKSGTTKLLVSAEGEHAVPLLTKIRFKLGLESAATSGERTVPISNGIDDLRFFSEALNASGRRLVIEDFHYLPASERRSFASDLKTLWDFQTYVVIIGIWTESNLLLHLNPDLAGRVEERSIFWSPTELNKVLEKGSGALNVVFSKKIKDRLVRDSFGTVGILQRLALALLDEEDIEIAVPGISKPLDDLSKYESVALAYADQLNAIYLTFASRVANGVRVRKNATGIYGQMLKTVMEATDEELTSGLPVAKIFEICSKREPRIQKGNLKLILQKIESLQIDSEGRGLVISYDENKGEVFVVDKQLLFYRKYGTAKWPWEQLIADSMSDDLQFTVE